jgi:hypothetical protein
MKKQVQSAKRGSVTEEIERLKQRREDRKIKNNEDKNSEKKNEDTGKACDAHYENLMKKKKIAFNIEPERVNKIKNLNLNIYFFV